MILLVDDEKAIRLSLGEYLRLNGYEVTEVGSGAAAVEFLQARHKEIGLVLLDISMPGMSGIDLVTAMDQEGWDIPTLLLSAHDEQEALEAVQNNPYVVGYLRKPFQADLLLTSVARVLPIT